MKPIHLLLAALVALLIGGGAGYLIGAEGAAPVSRTGPVGNGSEAPGRDNIAPTEKPAAQPQPDSKSPTPERAPDLVPVAPGDTGTLAAWLATLGDVKPNSGKGRVHGRVAQKDGTPVVDASITATPTYPDKPQPNRNNEEKPLEQAIEDQARRTIFTRAGKLETRTDADGRYEFTGLGDYEFYVWAKAPGFEMGFVGRVRRTGNVRPDAEVDFLAKPVCELELDIRLPDGTQPKSAQASLARANNSNGFGWRPDSPTTKSDAGKCTLTVTAGGYGQLLCDPMEIELVEGKPLKLTVQLKAVPGIFCNLTTPKGLGEEARPYVRLQADPPAEPPTTMPRGASSGRSIYDEDEGTVFINLKPGPYRLIAMLGSQVVAWLDVSLADEFKAVTLVIPEPDKKDFIVVRVNGPDGKPAKPVRLNVTVRSENSSSGGDSRVIEQAGGSFWVSRTVPDARRFPADKPWWYDITATCEAFGATTARYESAATHELAIQFSTPSNLTILIPGATSHPLKARLRPNLSRSEVDGRSWSGISPSGRPSSRGLESDTLKYGPISPGKYRFTLTLSGSAEDEDWGGRGSQIAEMTFDVTSGDNTQSCAIPVLCKLTVVITDIKAVQNLSLRPAAEPGRGSGNREVSGENIKERTVFEGLAAGEWIITTREGEMRVNLTGDTEVKLIVRKYDCLLLSGVKSGGKIEALGLREGDKVIRVDGTEIENPQSTLEAVLITSLGKDSTTWTVQRAGANVDVTFNGKELMKLLTDRTEGNRENFNPRPAVRD